MNRDNDDTFISLLSNQRKLLMQIQQDLQRNVPGSSSHHQQSQVQRLDPNNTITAAISGIPSQNAAMTTFPSSSIQSQYGAGSESAFQVVNSQQSHLPLHFSRLSQDNVNILNVAAPSPAPSQSLSLPLPPSSIATNRPQQLSAATTSRNRTPTYNVFQDSMFEPTPLRMEMRRLSLSLGFSSPADLGDFLEDPSAVPRSRRSSEKLTSVNQKTHDSNMHDLSRIQASQGLFDMDNDSPGDSSFSNIFDDLKPRHSSPKDKDTATEKKETSNDKKREKKRRKKNAGASKETEKNSTEDNTTYQSNIKNRKISSEVEKLAEALEKSAKSQQDIHKWDRKMGLKRSHSKTMTQSMQSRKRLRDILHNISDTIKKPS